VGEVNHGAETSGEDEGLTTTWEIAVWKEDVPYGSRVIEVTIYTS